MTVFTDLPLEIRWEIYRHLAPDNGTGRLYMLLEATVASDLPHGKFRCTKTQTAALRTYLTLRLICRSVYADLRCHPALCILVLDFRGQYDYYLHFLKRLRLPWHAIGEVEVHVCPDVQPQLQDSPFLDVVRLAKVNLDWFLIHSRLHSISRIRFMIKGEPGCCRYEDNHYDPNAAWIGNAELEDVFSPKSSCAGTIKLDGSDILRYVRRLREKRGLPEPR